MAKMKSDVVYLKDLVKRLDGATLRDVAGLELKIQGWEWCDMEELVGNFMNNIRLRTNNGWTPDELFANSSVQNANAPFVRTHPTVGRNAPCPCGSGKKYKKCCGKL